MASWMHRLSILLGSPYFVGENIRSPGQIARGLFTTFHADTPDGERFLQVLNGRFLQFASISYVSPQKSSNIHAIYYYCNGGNCAQCSTELAPIIEFLAQGSIKPEPRWLVPLRQPKMPENEWKPKPRHGCWVSRSFDEAEVCQLGGLFLSPLE